MKHQRLVLAAAFGAAFANSAAAQNIGPSTTTEPYILPSMSGVSTTSILTTGDKVGAYRMVGTPDGLGLWKAAPASGATTQGNISAPAVFNLVMNHEFGRTSGAVRKHGAKGSFVSRWTLDSTLKILSGRDHMNAPANLHTWNGTQYVTGASALERFCSGDLAAPGAYSQSATPAFRIFLSGEETAPPFTADHGRVFAHVVDGAGMNASFELPRLGKVSFETAVANPFPQTKTIVMINDDAGRDPVTSTSAVCRSAGQTGCTEPPSELYMYVGTKQSSGLAIVQAGLTNGNLYGIRVRVRGQGIVAAENKDFVFGLSAPAVTTARFETVNHGNLTRRTGADLEDASIRNKITQFVRIEDGAWDPRPGKQNDYYFITTGRLTTSSTTWRPSRLWRLRFDDIANPEAGGQIDMILTNQFYAGAGTTPDADPGYQMFDNITIDKNGRILLLEDVGGNDRLGRVYVYGIDSGNLVQVATANPKFFKPGGASFITNDEEASGVIDASDMLGDGWFLTSFQNHKASTDPELVEGGQLLAIYIDPTIGEAASSVNK